MKEIQILTLSALKYFLLTSCNFYHAVLSSSNLFFLKSNEINSSSSAIQNMAMALPADRQDVVESWLWLRRIWEWFFMTDIAISQKLVPGQFFLLYGHPYHATINIIPFLQSFCNCLSDVYNFLYITTKDYGQNWSFIGKNGIFWVGTVEFENGSRSHFRSESMHNLQRF